MSKPATLTIAIQDADVEGNLLRATRHMHTAVGELIEVVEKQAAFAKPTVETSVVMGKDTASTREAA